MSISCDKVILILMLFTTNNMFGISVKMTIQTKVLKHQLTLLKLNEWSFFFRGRMKRSSFTVESN